MISNFRERRRYTLGAALPESLFSSTRKEHLFQIRFIPSQFKGLALLFLKHRIMERIQALEKVTLRSGS